MSRQLASILQKAGILTAEESTSALQRSTEKKQSLRDLVLQERRVTEEQLANLLSQHLRVPYVRLAAASIDPDAVKLLAEEKARKYLCVPIQKDETGPGKRPNLVLAMAEPSDLAAVQEVEFATGCTVKSVVATATEIKDCINSHYAPEDWLHNFLKDVDEPENIQLFTVDEDESNPAGLLSDKTKTPAVKMVNLLIQNGIKTGASDIHIEAELNHVQVRNRVQGLLRDYLQLPKWIHEPLVSRIKILANLDITERRVPQDGRIKVAYERRGVDLRVSTLPTHLGEKVVLRVLGAGQAAPPTSSLGLEPQDLEALKTAADQPQGLILVTGPTGSGKTTTLYSVVNEKKSPDINIITVEDPIEFQLPGINQVQVNTKAGLTFASSLRSILRQDPDVILVGEIRDLETAEIAFHAAMTGHLVLSTLHTNSTVPTISRLLDLGIEPSLISSAINLVIAQRLLRVLCDKCKKPGVPDPKMLERLRLDASAFTFYEPVGCTACDKTGYNGRTGVYEILRLTPPVKKLISAKASEHEIQDAALRAGMVPLLQRAVELVRNGRTSVEEVLRVIQLHEDELTRCPNCRAVIDSQFAACPHCAHSLRTACESCQQVLKPEWKICPYCSTPVGQPAVTAAAASVSAAPIAPVPEAAPAKPDEIRQPKILVVDDDEVMRIVIVRALELLPGKPRVEEAGDGVSALAAVAEMRPDLVVLDLNMPGMSGFEVCHKLRRDISTAFLPIIMLTASMDEESRTKAFLVGTDDYMAKPISTPELHSRVGRLLRRTYGM